MADLSRTSPNMNSIREVCDRLGKTFLMSLVRNHWATGGLQVNSTTDCNISFVPAQGEYNIADPTLKADCAQGSRKSKIGWELTKNGCHVRSPGL